MSIVDSLLKDIVCPRMVPVRQMFTDDSLRDVEGEIRKAVGSPAIAERIKPGMRIAIGVGSRGMDKLPLLVSVLVDELKQRRARPFIVPAMGSHGGATDSGQLSLLAALGVTEASAGCPIISSMETDYLGELENGLPILIDRQAMQADGIVIINRIKPHTNFNGPVESGLLKMISIGLGKQKGADSCHAMGFGHMAENIVEMAKVKLRKAPFLFGVATIENAYDKISKLLFIPPEEILTREPQLLIEARNKMPKILFNPLDVLVVDQMGKGFSGTGTDPNITGRAATKTLEHILQVSRMVVLDLSDASHGNATGVGLADICTRRLVNKIDFNATYANHITSTLLAHAKIPVTMDSDLRSLQIAIKTCNVLDFSKLRIARIQNTLHLEKIMISEGLLADAEQHPSVEVCGRAEDWPFDSSGNLTDIGTW